MFFWIIGLLFVCYQAGFDDLVQQKKDEFMSQAHATLASIPNSLAQLKTYKARLENKMNFAELTRFHEEIFNFIRDLDSFNLDMFQLNKKITDDLRHIGKDLEDPHTLNMKIRELASQINKDICEMSEEFFSIRQDLVTLLNETNQQILGFFRIPPQTEVQL